MRTNIENAFWKADLAAFGKRNHLRPTRLEVLGPDRNIESDFWLEDGLLLAGIDLDTDGEHGPSVEIMLQGSKATSSNQFQRTLKWNDVLLRVRQQRDEHGRPHLSST